MTRLSPRTYDRRVLIAMSIYVVLMICVWPLARNAANIPLKLVYALTPVVPLLYTVWLMARRILGSDELEQRTHLIGIGVGAAVTSVFSIVTGFLAAAKVFDLETTSIFLIWIFPLLMLSYGIGRALAARRYGLGACDDDSDGMPSYIRFMYASGIFCVVAAIAYFYSGDERITSFALGMASSLVTGAVFFGVRRWLRRRKAQ
ncbi:MAG TPA: hypothetical protein VH082_14000 [Rudaea sp.]|nr:hypothetical protein [Rudaea sp.]